ncbi:amidohydrolase family protein [Roseococcus pinisoli]|uniref:Amidohydrolase family protein n=1 Tax=Roseococcus pinisoli TaxID=2835040 RepID=A0ABS5QFU6_9PROT|nr:amidohydrolase family protein [Roseococcus pinisoli]MBS7811820.1 amidohydrolase family protein [Roseococcus pinisoli]
MPIPPEGAMDGGPVIDCHHHLWDLSLGKHAWLSPEAGLAGLGDLAYLRRDYGPAEIAADIAGTGVVASVHVEALWDETDPVGETAWLDTLALPPGIAARCVAAAPLADPHVETVLAAQARHPRVAGIRQTLRWHPDPAMRWGGENLLENPAWRRGVGRLTHHGLLLEVLTNPWQATAIAELAADFPDLPIVVNHCCSPMDRDEAGIRRWHEGLAALGRRPSIHLKLSNLARYAPAFTPEAARAVLQPCLDAFGAERCLWGSDYPVARRELGYAATLDLFRRAIATLPAAAQRALLHDNAARLYGIEAG